MTQPVTELDARFSDPAALAADWDQTRRTLEGAYDATRRCLAR